MKIDVLALHWALVAIPSVSHDEQAIADFVEGYLRDHGVAVERIGDNVVAGEPGLLLCGHLDTVPPNKGWTRPPWEVSVEDGRVHGLGSNDAKASVAAMIAALLDCEGAALLLVPDEESGGRGAEVAWPALRDRGWAPRGVVVGEPTALDLAVSQRGMLVVELVAEGDACHSANANAMGARSPVATLARDLVALQAMDLGPDDPDLGPTTLQPTVLAGGGAHNQVPAEARCMLDLRTVPTTPHAALLGRLRATVASRVEVRSQRLEPFACPPDAAVIAAARAARPEARLCGSPTMSDLVWFRSLPAIKVGPGRTQRSHRPDEYVLEEKVLAGAAFYTALARAFAAG